MPTCLFIVVRMKLALSSPLTDLLGLRAEFNRMKADMESRHEAELTALRKGSNPYHYCALLILSHIQSCTTRVRRSSCDSTHFLLFAPRRV